MKQPTKAGIAAIRDCIRAASDWDEELRGGRVEGETDDHIEKLILASATLDALEAQMSKMNRMRRKGILNLHGE